MYLIVYNYARRCAENHTPQDHFRCVMVCYRTYTPRTTRPGMYKETGFSKTIPLVYLCTKQEPIFLLEGSYEEYLSDVISTLRVRCLTEALPETRFNRLLHKKKFEEAEKFARQFQLDVEVCALKIEMH